MHRFKRKNLATGAEFNVSVAQYFKETFGKELKYPMLPVMICQKSLKDSKEGFTCYPMEVMRSKPEPQTLRIEKLSVDQQAIMIKVCNTLLRATLACIYSWLACCHVSVKNSH